MPSGRLPPLAFGISTCRAGCSLQLPSRSWPRIVGPVLFSGGAERLETHTLDSRGSLVGPDLRQCLLGLARSTNASRVRSRHRPDFAIDGRRAAAWLARRAFAVILATRRRSPAVRSSAFSTRLPDMPLPVLDGRGLRDQVPARPTGEGLVSRSCSSGRGFAPRCFRAPPRGYPRFRKAWVAAEGAGRPRPVRNGHADAELAGYRVRPPRSLPQSPILAPDSHLACASRSITGWPYPRSSLVMRENLEISECSDRFPVA